MMTAPTLPMLPNTLPTAIELVAHIRGVNVAIGRLPDARYVLLGVNGRSEARAITPILTVDEIDVIADGVLAGEPRYVTWPHAAKVLALGVAIGRLPPRPGPEAAAAPVPSPVVPPSAAVAEAVSA